MVVLTEDTALGEAMVRDLEDQGIKVRIFSRVGTLLSACANDRPAVAMIDDRYPGPSAKDLSALMHRHSPMDRCAVVSLTFGTNGQSGSGLYNLDALLASTAEARGQQMARGHARTQPLPMLPLVADLPVVPISIFERDPAPFEIAAVLTPMPMSATPRPGPRRVLIGDDDHVSRDLLRHELRKLGVEVTLVEDGEAADAALQAERYDVALLEAHLPYVNGYELVAKHRARCDHTRLVVLSVQAHDESALRAYAVGADDFIAKPLNPSVLARRIERLIDRATSTARPTH